MDGTRMSQPGVFVERTLALIKPDVIQKAEEIEELILNSGFTILQVGALAKIILARLQGTEQIV